MNRKDYPQLNETLYYETLDNGLTVFLIPKPEFNQTCGAFATKFGNIQCNGEIMINNKYVPLPSGVAHFLEHRLFDYKKGNVIDLFSSFGALSNAFTSYDKTVYYFTTTDNVNKCVNTLLDFVSELNVSEESVEKEKEIIVQELLMYLDNPDIVLNNNTYKNAYHYHMIKDDVGGDEASVRSTTLEVLQGAHQTFYHPSNMIFVLTGNFDVKKMMELIKNNQQTKEFKPPLKYRPHQKVEPLKVVKEEDSISMHIAFDKCSLIFKLPPYRKNADPFQIEVDELSGNILLDILFSLSGDVNSYLLENKITTSHLRASFYNELRTAVFATISANVYDKERFVKVILDSLNNYERFITKDKVDSQKRSLIGQYLNSFNDTERIGVEFLTDEFKGISYLDKIKVIDKITLASVKKMAERIIKANHSIFTIYANREQK